MPRSKRATLRSQWWRNYYNSIAHCFRCGKPLHRKYVKEEKTRRHVCTSCGEITYLNPKVVAALIPILSDGRVVLLRRAIEPALGKWSYPAGFQELGETSEQAAIRETWEEITAKTKINRFLGVYTYEDAGVVTLVYVGKILKSSIPKPGSESLEVKAFRKSEIPWGKLAFRSTKDALKDWGRGLRQKKTL